MRDPALADLVSDATRQAFARIVALCLEEKVDALLIAGDLYDGDQTSMKTARFIAEGFKRLTDAGVRVFLIRGNHDNLSKITRELSLPKGVTLFGKSAGIVQVDRSGGMPIAVHGLSFTAAHAPENLLPRYSAPIPDAFNIGLMHTSLGGSPGHSVYAPCSEAELKATGFRYWALGHIHKRNVIEGQTTVVMPGMPQGRDINEDGPKSVTLASVADDGSLSYGERIVGPAMFQRGSVDIGGVDDMREVIARAARTLSDLKAACPADHLISRLTLEGITPLAWRVRRDLERLSEEISLQLGPGRGIWIESLNSSARTATHDVAATDAAADLARIAATEVLKSDGFTQAAKSLALDFVSRHVPHELKDLLGDDEAAAAAAVEKLAADGLDDVLSRILVDDLGEPG